MAHASRMYDYLLGGTDNFEIDREAAERASAAFGGVEVARTDVRANRAFLGRAIRYLVGEAGVRQFLDIGTGVPNDDNTHGVAQQAAPECRVVYVDNDPIVLAHAHTLLRSTPEGATAYLDGDLRDPESVLQAASATLDFAEPVAVVLAAVLHVIPDGDDPYGIVARLLDVAPAGSHLVVTHLASDVQATEQAEAVRRLNERSRETYVLRSRDEVGRFFDGLDLVGPGVVGVDRWLGDRSGPSPDGARRVPIYGAVGRKPTAARRRIEPVPEGEGAPSRAGSSGSSRSGTGSGSGAASAGPVTPVAQVTGRAGSTRWATGRGVPRPGRRLGR